MINDARAEALKTAVDAFKVMDRDRRMFLDSAAASGIAAQAVDPTDWAEYLARVQLISALP